MLNRQKPDFNIGDVVEWALNIWTHGVKGIIVAAKSDSPESSHGFLYAFYGFHNLLNDGEQYPDESRVMTITSEFLRACRDSCKDCKYEDICSQMKEIAACNNSEFGQLRGAGKYDPDVCEQKKCHHLLVCGMNKFIRN